MTDDELRLLLATLTPREIVMAHTEVPLVSPVRVIRQFLLTNDTLAVLLLPRLAALAAYRRTRDASTHPDRPFLDAIEDLLEEHLLRLCEHSDTRHPRLPLRDIIKSLPTNYLHKDTAATFSAALKTLTELWPVTRHRDTRVSSERWSQLIVRSGEALTATREGRGAYDARYAAYGKILDTWLLL